MVLVSRSVWRPLCYSDLNENFVIHSTALVKNKGAIGRRKKHSLNLFLRRWQNYGIQYTAERMCQKSFVICKNYLSLTFANMAEIGLADSE